MNQKHIPNLELCQEFDRLCKEKNITLPETEFYWKVGKASGHANLTTDKPDLENWTKTDDGFDWYHAPLVSEQGEWLPPAIKVKDALAYLKYVPHSDKQTDVIYSKVGWFHQESDYKEANARQKMINYLLAEGIITTL